MATKSLPAVKNPEETNEPKPKSTKSAGHRVPAPQALRMKRRHAEGQSAREIALAEGRDRATVGKVIRSDEMGEYVRHLRERLHGAGESAIDSLQRALKQTHHARLAYLLLRDIGAIPSPAERALLLNAASTGDEAQREKEMMGRLLEVALERRKVYGTPMPELEGDLKAARLKINAETGQLEATDDEPDPK